MIKFDYFNRSLISPDYKQLAASNIVFMIVCLTMAALIGSVASVFAVCGVLYTLFLIIQGSVKVRRDWPVLAVSLSFAAYFVAEMLSAIINPGDGTMPELISTALFLGFLPLISPFAVNPSLLVEKIELPAAIVSFISTFVAAALIIGEFHRIELAAGNPGVLAVVASVLLLINLNAAFRQSHKYWQFNLAGCLASSFIILLTGMRALWPVLVVLPVLVFVMSKREAALSISRRALVGIAIGVMLVSISSYPLVSSRLVQLSNNLNAISKGKYNSSIGDRVVLWRAGYQLAVAQPILGYGPGNVTKVMVQSTAKTRVAKRKYTHFHNAFLNETIRAGLVGLIAMLGIFIVPLIVVLKAERKGAAGSAATILLGTQIIYMFSGLTGIMLGHDILDSLYLCVTVFCVYIAYPKDNTVDIEL